MSSEPLRLTQELENMMEAEPDQSHAAPCDVQERPTKRLRGRDLFLAFVMTCESSAIFLHRTLVQEVSCS